MTKPCRKKILIIRLSSFGDIIQCMSVIPRLESSFDVSWVVRDEFKDVVAFSNTSVIPFNRKEGLVGLVRLGLSLRAEKFAYVYDAHKNLRSRILKFILLFNNPVPKTYTRSKNRLKRILLFKFGINLFTWPFKGMISYQEPIEHLLEGNKKFIPNKLSSSNLDKYFTDKPVIALAPSAAWEMKTWPKEHWKKLIEITPYNFLVLGGPADKFCNELESKNSINLAGKLTLLESCEVVKRADMLISADTGLLHVADLFGTKGIALIGPTAFGFPTGEHIKVLERELTCRPCTKDGRGKCKQDVYKKCMVEITPEEVKERIGNI